MKDFLKTFAAMMLAWVLTIVSAGFVHTQWGEIPGQISLFVFMAAFFLLAIMYAQRVRDRREGITPELRAAVERLRKGV